MKQLHETTGRDHPESGVMCYQYVYNIYLGPSPFHQRLDQNIKVPHGGGWELDVGEQTDIKSRQSRGSLGLEIFYSGGRSLICSEWACTPSAKTAYLFESPPASIVALELPGGSCDWRASAQLWLVCQLRQYLSQLDLITVVHTLI